MNAEKISWPSWQLISLNLIRQRMRSFTLCCRRAAPSPLGVASIKDAVRTGRSDVSSHSLLYLLHCAVRARRLERA